MMKGRRKKMVSLRVTDDGRWQRAMDKAAESDQSLSEVLDEFLKRYAGKVKVTEPHS